MSSFSQSSIAAMKNVLAEGDGHKEGVICGCRRAGTTARLCRSRVKGEGGRAGQMPNLSSLYTLFYSVIYNSVGKVKFWQFLQAFWQCVCLSACISAQSGTEFSELSESAFFLTVFGSLKNIFFTWAYSTVLAFKNKFLGFFGQCPNLRNSRIS